MRRLGGERRRRSGERRRGREWVELTEGGSGEAMVRYDLLMSGNTRRNVGNVWNNGTVRRVTSGVLIYPWGKRVTGGREEDGGEHRRGDHPKVEEPDEWVRCLTCRNTGGPNSEGRLCTEERNG